MKRLQANKYELMPNGKQMRAMRGFAGSCRVVRENAALATTISHRRKRPELV
jgi:putative transposase